MGKPGPSDSHAGTGTRSQDDRIRSYIAPWALAREGVPVHVILDSPPEFDTIQILLPDGVTITDYLNVETMAASGRTITIQNLSTTGFFGFVVMNDELFEPVHVRKSISIRFMLGGSVVLEQVLTANFYRPHLEIIDKPTKLTITDTSDPKTLLAFKIGVFGFGRVNIMTEVDAGSDIRVLLESYFKNLVRQVVAKYSSGEYVRPDDPKYEDTDRLLARMEEFLGDLSDEEIPPKMKQDLLEQTRNWMHNTMNHGKILEELAKEAESLFLDMLLFQFEKFPADNVSLNYGRPSLFAQKLSGSVTVRLRYWDSMGNEYKPVEIPIEIVDERTEKVPREVPINIEWSRKPFSALEESSRIE